MGKRNRFSILVVHSLSTWVLHSFPFSSRGRVSWSDLIGGCYVIHEANVRGRMTFFFLLPAQQRNNRVLLMIENRRINSHIRNTFM